MMMLSQRQFSLSRCKYEHKKKQKDRFEDLPEELVSHIVSYFTPKDAAKARSLSSTWRRRCASMSILEFRLGHMFTPPTTVPSFNHYRDKFVKAVNQFLRGYQEDHDGSPLYAFRIHCLLQRNSTSDIDAWLRFADSRGVQLLSLTLGDVRSHPEEKKYIFSAHLLSPQNNLRILQLSSCLLGPGVIHHFHSITYLRLGHTSISREEIESIGSYCLNLEKFTLVASNVPSKLCISASSFQRLKLLSIITCHGLEEIAISSNNLTSFEYAGPVVKLCFSRASNLENVYFRPQDESGIKYIFHQLAKHLSLVKNLSIDTGKIDWMGHILPNQNAIFNNVKKLEMSFHGDPMEKLTLFAHLKSFPLLEKLFLAIEFNVNSFEETDLVVNERLKEVYISGFYYCTPLMHLVFHFLNLGAGLEKMVLDFNYRYYRGADYWGHSTRNCDESAYQDISDRFVGSFKANVIILS